MSRQFWVIAHRWAGLTISVFLIVAGVTGALLPFNQELSDMTAPWRVVVPPDSQAPLLDALTLNEAAQRAAPNGYVTQGLRLNVESQHVLEIGLSPLHNRDQPYLYAAVDPYTGKVVHLGRAGAISDGWDQIMPFVYALHYTLAMGAYGSWAFGLAALVWTIDCFVGLYLTLPMVRWHWWARWRKAWSVRLQASRPIKLNFDVHRAGGLWLWPILLVFAWSSVGMNLREVYNPVMRALGARSPYASLPEHGAEPGFKPSWRTAYAQARELTARAGIHTLHEYSMFFDPGKGVFAYNFQSSRDFTDQGGSSSVLFYPDGTLAKIIIADGGLGNGGADAWLMALHTAQVGGLPYRIFVSLLGILIVALSVTGVVIWMTKRSAALRLRAAQLSCMNP